MSAGASIRTVAFVSEAPISVTVTLTADASNPFFNLETAFLNSSAQRVVGKVVGMSQVLKEVSVRFSMGSAVRYLLGMKTVWPFLSVILVYERVISSTVPSKPLIRMRSWILKKWPKMSDRLQKRLEASSFDASANTKPQIPAHVRSALTLMPAKESTKTIPKPQMRTVAAYLRSGRSFFARGLDLRTLEKVLSRTVSASTLANQRPATAVMIESDLSATLQYFEAAGTASTSEFQPIARTKAWIQRADQKTAAGAKSLIWKRKSGFWMIRVTKKIAKSFAFLFWSDIFALAFGERPPQVTTDW